MSRPVKEKSVDAATATGAGGEMNPGGRITLSLFVAVGGTLDTSNDTLDVQLEVSMDGNNWTPLRDESGSQIGSVSASDFSSDQAAYVTVHGVAAQYVRANLTGYADSANGDLGSVDAYVSASSNPNSAYDYREVGST